MKTKPNIGDRVAVVAPPGGGDLDNPTPYVGLVGDVTRLVTDDCGATPKDPLYIVDFGGFDDGCWAEELVVVPKDTPSSLPRVGETVAVIVEVGDPAQTRQRRLIFGAPAGGYVQGTLVRIQPGPDPLVVRLRGGELAMKPSDVLGRPADNKPLLVAVKSGARPAYGRMDAMRALDRAAQSLRFNRPQVPEAGKLALDLARASDWFRDCFVPKGNDDVG